jgi:hypothetical protein
LSFNRLSGDDEPGRGRIDLHCPEKIGRTCASNNELAWSSDLACDSYGLQSDDARPADADLLAIAAALRP